MSSLTGNKLFWIDNLRVIATISVIVLHITAVLVLVPASSTWKIGNVVQSLVRCAVPIFFMLSGALLLGSQENIKTFVKKRFIRIIFPLLFWSLPYIYINLYVLNSKGTYLDLLETCRFVFEHLRNGSFYHLWFVYEIIGLYLIMPLLNKWIVNSTRNEQLYFLIIWLITIIIRYPGFELVRTSVNLNFFTGYLGYLVLGYYLKNLHFKSNKFKDHIAVSLFIVGFIATYVGTSVLSYEKGVISQFFYEYLTLNVALCATGLFLFFRDKNITHSPLVRMRDFINKHSYGIYLSHVLVLVILRKIGIYALTISPFIGVVLTTLFCLAVSSSVVYIVAKLPYGKYLAG